MRPGLYIYSAWELLDTGEIYTIHMQLTCRWSFWANWPKRLKYDQTDRSPVKLPPCHTNPLSAQIWTLSSLTLLPPMQVQSMRTCSTGYSTDKLRTHTNSTSTTSIVACSAEVVYIRSPRLHNTLKFMVRIITGTSNITGTSRKYVWVRTNYNLLCKVYMHVAIVSVGYHA